MSRIKTIHIHNFKFFDEQRPIELGDDGKHLLLYGENGCGKSSVYWALYTLFECAVKYDKAEIEKYFKHADDHPQSLINIHSTKIPQAGNTPEHYNSFIKVETTDAASTPYEVSLLNTSISGNSDAVEINQASDFINYKVLFKFQDFWNGEPIDLAKIFEGYVLPYVRFTEFSLWREGTMQPRTSAIEMWEEIKTGPGETINGKGDTIQVYKNSKENKQFEKFAKHFDDRFKDLIEFINANAPAMLKKFGYDMDFELKYHEHTHKKGDSKYDCSIFKIDLTITSYLGNPINIYRPQSFLNEAKITAIAIAIRLTILRKRINEQAPNVLKFIVFDDVMISLDMNNRDKLIDFILNKENKFTEDYQLLFLTHDKNFYDFVAFKIKQWYKNMNEWVCKEMYIGKDDTLNKEYPIFIDGLTEYIEKAKKHFARKDYTSCALYIRKELEKLVIERLPDEVKERTDGSFLPLKILWDKMVDRYSALGITILKTIKDGFEESKLLVLNPQAHHQATSLPVYKVEIEKAFDLIEKLKTNYPIPIKTILVSKGMQCIFTHPSIDYTFEFEFLQDLIIDNLNGALALNDPKCNVTYWQFEKKPYWNLKENREAVVKSFELKFHKITEILTTSDTVPPGITKLIITDNTTIKNVIWNLKEIFTKSNISL